MLDGRDVSARDPRARSSPARSRSCPRIRAVREILVAPPAGVGRAARRRRGRGARHRHGRVPRRDGQGVPRRERRRAGPPPAARRGGRGPARSRSKTSRPRSTGGTRSTAGRAVSPLRRGRRRDRDRHDAPRCRYGRRRRRRPGPSRGGIAMLFYDTVPASSSAGGSVGRVPGCASEHRERLPAAGRLRARAVAPFDDGHPVRGVAVDAPAALHGQGVAVPDPGRGLRSSAGSGGFEVARDGTDRKALRDSIAMLQAGEVLLVYPEGTRQHGPKIQPLQPGAAYLALRAGVPIVPVGHRRHRGDHAQPPHQAAALRSGRDGRGRADRRPRPRRRCRAARAGRRAHRAAARRAAGGVRRGERAPRAR